MKIDKQTHFENIENYLAGKLKGKALEKIEQALQMQEGFAEEVDLHKNIGDALRHSPEDDLRANLDKLGQKHSLSAPTETRFKKWGSIGILLLLGGLAWWWLSVDNNLIKNEAHHEKIEESNTAVPKEEIFEKIKEVDIAIPPTEKQKEAGKKVQKPKSKLKNIPLAANFETNPMLDIHIGDSVRGGDYAFDVILPQKETTLTQVEGKSIFHFSGILETEETDISANFQVHLFSNKKEAYENFESIFVLPLSFTPKAADEFTFDVSRKEALVKGLYYYLLEDADSGEIVFVGKVFVR